TQPPAPAGLAPDIEREDAGALWLERYLLWPFRQWCPGGNRCTLALVHLGKDKETTHEEAHRFGGRGDAPSRRQRSARREAARLASGHAARQAGKGSGGRRVSLRRAAARQQGVLHHRVVRTAE